VGSLHGWERALCNAAADGSVTVMHGTKGGRTRQSPPIDRERAAAVVRRAIDWMQNSRGRLVRKPGLEAAMNRYRYVVRKAGMTGERAPHSLRYGYAVEHLQRLETAGVSRREAAAAVSSWVGQGDGRGASAVADHTALVANLREPEVVGVFADDFVLRADTGEKGRDRRGAVRPVQQVAAEFCRSQRDCGDGQNQRESRLRRGRT